MAYCFIKSHIPKTSSTGAWLEVSRMERPKGVGGGRARGHKFIIQSLRADRRPSHEGFFKFPYLKFPYGSLTKG